MGLLVDREVERRLHLLQHAAVGVTADSRIELLDLLEDFAVLQHVQQLLVGRQSHPDLHQLEQRLFPLVGGKVRLRERGPRLAHQPRTEQILPVVEVRHRRLQLVELVRRHRHRSGDDQRRPRLVDQNAVDLVDDRIVVVALNQLRRLVGHAHVAQVVETELTVGAVGDVAGVLLAPNVGRLLILQTADRDPEIAENRPHPAGVAQCKVVVDRDQLAVPAGQRVQVQRQRRHQGFAFAGGHLRDVAAMKRDSAHQLNVEGNHVPDHLLAAHLNFRSDQPPTGVLDGGERLAHDVVERLAVGQTFLEKFGIGFEFLVGKRLIRLLQFIDPPDQRKHLAQVTLRLGTENQL